MQQISDISQFTNLTKKITTTNKHFLTNCYMLPGEINYYIERKRLFWKELKSGVAFLCKEKLFYRLYFYITDQPDQNSGEKFESLEKPVMIDLVYTESKKPRSITDSENLWIQKGFRKYKLYKKYSLYPPFKMYITPKPIPIGDDVYTLEYAQPEHAEAITKLWEDHLDIFRVSLPDKDEFIASNNRKEIFCMLNKEKLVVAAIQMQRNGRTGMLKHLAIHENYRNRGLSAIIFQRCITELEDCNHLFSWVAEDNFAIIKLITKCGYQFDGKVSSQLILE